MRYLPVLNFVNSGCALAFQIFVLHPWTKEFDKKVNYQLRDLTKSANTRNNDKHQK